MARPDDPPEPPPDLARRTLPITEITTPLIRIHRHDRGALYFGASGGNRFDAPDGEFGVCYTARTLEGAFAETCLRVTGAQFVTRAFLAGLAFSGIPITGTLRVVSLHGPGLAAVGATAAVTSGAYQVARRWSGAFHAHPSGIDGIAYLANHDNAEICVALFDRCRGRLGVPLVAQGLLSDTGRLGRLLDRYQVGLG